MQNLEKVYKQLFSKKEDLSHVKYKYNIIDRLISIKVLWKFFYPNTSSKGEF